VGELDCVQQCFLDGAAQSKDLLDLLASCATTCAGACLSLADSTNAVLACALDECEDECFPVD
jgi:hypothetical protein